MDSFRAYLRDTPPHTSACPLAGRMLNRPHTSRKALAKQSTGKACDIWVSRIAQNYQKQGREAKAMSPGMLLPESKHVVAGLQDSGAVIVLWSSVVYVKI